MLKQFRYLITVLTLFTGSLAAYIHPCPGEWGIQAEFLYLYPSVDDTYFVIDSSSFIPVQGRRENNDFDFHPGFRIGAVYGLCGCNQEIQLFYTRLGADENKTVRGEDLFATLGTPDLTVSVFQGYEGFATSDLDLLYQRVDALYAFQALNCCSFQLYLQGGLEFGYIRLHENYVYQETVGDLDLGTINQKSRAWGVGPQFGIGFDYALWQCGSGYVPGTLSLNVLSSGSLLASKTGSRTFQVFNGDIILDVKDQKTWRIIPAWHARVGLNYGMCFSCFNSSLEVGYEFNSYSRAISRISAPDDVSPGLILTEYYNYDVQGLYIALGFTF